MPDKHEFLDRDTPQTARQTMPAHYDGSADVPHVLARVRAFDRFFRLHVDGQYPEVHVELYSAALAMLREDLAPYALDLALSLIALKDEVGDAK